MKLARPERICRTVSAAGQLLRVSQVGLGAEDFEEEEAGSDDDGGVGYVEVGPVVVDDADFEEVDDVAVADAVVEVAEGSAEDEGEGDAR